MTEHAQESNPRVVSAYLIIARYNRTKWQGLRAEDVLTAGNQLDPAAKTPTQEQAEDKAEELFPEEPRPLPQLAAEENETSASGGTSSPGQLKGARMVHTFYSDLHIQIDRMLQAQLEQTEDNAHNPEMRGKLDALVDRFYAQLANSALQPVQGTSVSDPGIGWMAVVDAVSFDPIIMEIAKRSEPLWRMYDIEVIPLNNDKTTQDVYELMTPVHWS